MKAIIKESFKKLITDRYLLVLLSSLILLAVVLAIAIGLSIHPSDRQLVSHYSMFGFTHYYYDQWFYAFVFVFFELAVAALHVIISVKLLIIKDRSFAIAFAWFGVGIVLIGWATAYAVLNPLL